MKTQNYLILDFETTTQKLHGRKANPFFNKIVAAGFATNSDFKTMYGKPLLYKEFKHYIEWADILIGHNLEFDLLFIWGEEHFQEWIKKGGVIWDTLVVEYMLSGQSKKYKDLSLRDVAVKMYYCEPRKKLMEPYWDNGTDTINIPKDLVIQDVLSDALDTEQIYLKQLEKLKAFPKLHNLIKLKMDDVLACIEKTWNGFKVDHERLKQNREELQKEADLVDSQVMALVDTYWK